MSDNSSSTSGGVGFAGLLTILSKQSVSPSIDVGRPRSSASPCCSSSKGPELDPDIHCEQAIAAWPSHTIPLPVGALRRRHRHGRTSGTRGGLRGSTSSSRRTARSLCLADACSTSVDTPLCLRGTAHIASDSAGSLRRNRDTFQTADTAVASQSLVRDVHRSTTSIGAFEATRTLGTGPRQAVENGADSQILASRSHSTMDGWWWVLSPLWISAAIGVAILLVLGLVALISAARS